MKVKRLTNKQILKDVVFGSRKKKIGLNGYYYYIYKVTCELIPDMMFISGCMTQDDPDLDNHVSKSIPGRGPYKKQNQKLFSYGWYLKKHNERNFERKNLLYFDCLEDLLKAEELVLMHNVSYDNGIISFPDLDYEKIRKVEWYRMYGLLTTYQSKDKDSVRIIDSLNC